MNTDRRLLVALAVVLAPGRAARLLGLLADPASAALLAEVERLAGAPRRDRLSALAGALTATAEPSPRDRRLIVRPSGPAAPPAVARTGVRGADGPAPAREPARDRTTLRPRGSAPTSDGSAVAGRVARRVERLQA